MLYQLSYASIFEMERGTGIEPATNSVEGCDSTVELPPHSGAELHHCISYYQYCHRPVARM